MFNVLGECILPESQPERGKADTAPGPGPSRSESDCAFPWAQVKRAHLDTLHAQMYLADTQVTHTEHPHEHTAANPHSALSEQDGGPPDDNLGI